MTAMFGGYNVVKHTGGMSQASQHYQYCLRVTRLSWSNERNITLPNGAEEIRPLLFCPKVFGLPEAALI